MKCELCGRREAKLIDHYEEHCNVKPEIYSKPSKRREAKEIEKKARSKIPGRINICDWCHACLHGEQWFDGCRSAFMGKHDENGNEKGISCKRGE
jgi:hypothetical protein